MYLSLPKHLHFPLVTIGVSRRFGYHFLQKPYYIATKEVNPKEGRVHKMILKKLEVLLLLKKIGSGTRLEKEINDETGSGGCRFLCARNSAAKSNDFCAAVILGRKVTAFAWLEAGVTLP